MSGSGVLIGVVRTAVHRRPIRRAPDHRRRIAVVFAAVRGSTTFRSASGALTVIGSTRIAGATSLAFVSPQDRVKILFSGAAFGSPYTGAVTS